LTVVVLLLLLSAVINYVNLNMALVGKRAREMATRRLLGAQKLSVMGKLIAESVLFTAVCFVFAFLLAYALVPTMNRLLVSNTPDADIQLRLLMTPAYIVAYMSGILLLGVLSGWLPALFVSRYAPIEVVRGAFRQYNKMWFNKIFIVFQSVLSFVLIALAIVMEVQMRHMVNRPTHLQTKDLFVIGAPYPPRAYLPIVEELRSLPCVEEVGIGQGYPGKINYSFGIPDMEDDSKSEITMATVLCDSIYFQLIGFEVIKDFGHPKANSLWLGEHVLVESGVSDTSTSFLNRIAAYFSTYYHLNVEYIGGVVYDFPVNGAACADGDYNLNGGVFVFDIEKMGYGVGLLVKTTGDHAEAERHIMDHYNQWVEKKEGVGRDVKCGYVDDLMLEQLEPAKRTVRLLELFMGLSVLISLLGLIAMSTYYSGENTQGIAIRKAFGSDVQRELWRTVRGYMLLVGLAAIIASPLAVWLCGKYLERFAYRIDRYGWIIAIAVLLTLVMAFLSVLWQTLRAAKTNPAEALKKE
jgi:putative ABC transport system permease protein